MIAEAYGAWQLKSMLGREYMGVARSTVIIDPNGKVARTFPKVSPSEHPAEVIVALKDLRGE